MNYITKELPENVYAVFLTDGRLIFVTAETYEEARSKAESAVHKMCLSAIVTNCRRTIDVIEG